MEPPGDKVPEREVPFPPPTAMPGTYTSLVPLSPAHSPSLFTHFGGDSNIPLWTFLPLPPLPDQPSCDALVEKWSTSPDPQYYAVTAGDGDDALGVMSFLNMVPGHRRLEIGWVVLGKALQRTRMATEAFYLLLRRAFDDLGYQRVEWKANSLNAASLAAAERLGFVYEGTCRCVNTCFPEIAYRRDTAWFSITDDEWPLVKKGFEAWLSESNFDAEGRQKRGLKACRESFN